MSVKTGLNDEQVKYITDFALEEGYVEADFSEDDFYEYLRECDKVGEVDNDERRHWEEYISIVEIGGRYFGFHDAHSSGDMSAREKGFEPDDMISEYEPQEIKTITYKLKKV